MVMRAWVDVVVVVADVDVVVGPIGSAASAAVLTGKSDTCCNAGVACWFDPLRRAGDVAVAWCVGEAFAGASDSRCETGVGTRELDLLRLCRIAFGVADDWRSGSVLSLDSAKVCWVSDCCSKLAWVATGIDSACEICVVVRVSCETGDAAVIAGGVNCGGGWRLVADLVRRGCATNRGKRRKPHAPRQSPSLSAPAPHEGHKRLGPVSAPTISKFSPFGAVHSPLGHLSLGPVERCWRKQMSSIHSSAGELRQRADTMLVVSVLGSMLSEVSALVRWLAGVDSPGGWLMTLGADPLDRRSTVLAGTTRETAPIPTVTDSADVDKTLQMLPEASIDTLSFLSKFWRVRPRKVKSARSSSSVCRVAR
jgi:hypothetical protein